jgi:prepilin-type N-terminal cleavage/methylation domain-containing protein
MSHKVCPRGRPTERGFTFLEMVIVVGVIAIVGAIGIPQVVGARRLIRSAGLTREITGGLRDARQMAISRRRAITFQYDDDAKVLKLIDHGVDAQGLGRSGVSVLNAGNYPLSTGNTVASTIQLTSGGLPADEIGFGLPTDVVLNANKLSDNTTLVALSNNQLNITFQPDGTIIDSTGAARDFAFIIYNTVKPQETAAAVSILGTTGRIKAWRYSESVQKFLE